MDNQKVPLTAKETLLSFANLGLLDGEIAKLLCVESTTVSRWRAGERNPTPDNERNIFEIGGIIKKILAKGEQITLSNILIEKGEKQ